VLDPDPALERLYLRALYRVETPAGARSFRIGDPVEDLDGTPFAMITAFNPGGAERPPAENRTANQRLRRALEDVGCTLLDGLSHDDAGMHREPQFAAFGLARATALEIARAFGQAAIVWFDGRTAQLVWTGERSTGGPP